MLTHIFRRQDPYNILNYRNQLLNFLFGTELKKWIVSLERRQQLGPECSITLRRNFAKPSNLVFRMSLKMGAT